MILLTFNIINNAPELKNGTQIIDTERLKITEKNINSILRILELYDIKATFFIDIPLLEELKSVLKKLVTKGHEVAFYNQNSSIQEVEHSKVWVQDFIEKNVRGFRQKDITSSISDLKKLEFNYVSNIENASILFPFKRLQRSTEISEESGLSLIPESISPYSQIPYNDFTFQILPGSFYRNMVFETLKAEEFVLIYLSTWQFTDLEKYPFKVPFYRRYNSGRKMEDKLEDFLKWINEYEFATSRIKDYIL